MALKHLTARLKSLAIETPETREESMGYQCKASIHAGCTPDTHATSGFTDTHAILQFGPFGEAVNDPSSEPPADPHAWRELAQAYHQHHFGCATCSAAGRGVGYGLRCGLGAALWVDYQAQI